jgi:hypothetical protein
MLRRLRVKADDVGPRLGEVRNDAVDGLDHQMNVDRRAREGADRAAHQRTDGEVRHVVIVHHVEMDPVGAGGDNLCHLFA